jgi:hypothetical protein
MASARDEADLSILFVADGPRLEVQSWLLAASLACAHASGPAPRIVAYATAAWLPRIGGLTRDLYDACGVELRRLPDAPAWRAPYPHGNKMIAAADRRETARAVFLDTDMICLRPLSEMVHLPPDTIAAAPEGVATWGKDGDRWDRVYAHFGLPYPRDRIRLLRGRRREFVPYFNAGFVAFPDRPDDGETPCFADRWIATALEIDHGCRVGGKRPWLDQISLPVTLARHGYRTEVLGESWNYSLARRKDLSETRTAHVLHYHRFRYLATAPVHSDVMDDFYARLPRRHQAVAEAALGLTDLAETD